MKQGMHGLAIALLVAFCASRPLRVFAQKDHPLEKKVTLNADHERLEAVLDELAKSGYFTFSYQSDIVKKDRLVTLTVKESTLREALELILGKAYDYLESDDYVIIRPRDPAARKDILVDPDDMRFVKAKALAAESTPAMKMKKRAQVMKRAMLYGSDSLHVMDSLNMAKLRQTVRNIVDDLIADGIIKNKDSFTWFALDNGQFVVDGMHLADSLRVRYAAKYVGQDGNGFYCGTLSGVQGRGYFFDKKEIYGGGKE